MMHSPSLPNVATYEMTVTIPVQRQKFNFLFSYHWF